MGAWDDKNKLDGQRTGSERAPEFWSRVVLFLFASLLIHGLGLVLGGWSLTHEDPPILQFQVPAEVQFGIVGGTGEPAPSESAPPAPPPKRAKKAKRKKKRRAKKPVVTKTVENGFGPVVDAGLPTPDVEADEAADEAVVQGPERDGEGSELAGVGVVSGAIGEGFGVGSGGHGLGGFGPPGAHIGLHVNVHKVAATSLVLEVRSILNVIPGWEDLLDASGLDPLKDFSHLFVATPDLKARNLVVSGRFRGTGKNVEGAVRRLARRRGKSASWTNQGGVRVAPWFGPDGVQRMVALPKSKAGDKRLVITKKRDLARVLSVVRILTERQGLKQPRDASVPSIVYKIYKAEAVGLSVDDARKFVVGKPPGIPGRARLSVRSIDEYYAGIAVIGRYENSAKAAAAQAYIEGLRTRLLDHSQVKYLGLVSALTAGKLRHRGRYLILDLKVTLHQARYLLEFVSDSMAR